MKKGGTNGSGSPKLPKGTVENVGGGTRMTKSKSGSSKSGKTNC